MTEIVAVSKGTEVIEDVIDGATSIEATVSSVEVVEVVEQGPQGVQGLQGPAADLSTTIGYYRGTSTYTLENLVAHDGRMFNCIIESSTGISPSDEGQTAWEPIDVLTEEQITIIKANLAALINDSPRSVEFLGVRQVEIVVHNTGRYVVPRFVARDGGEMSVAVRHVDINTVEISSVVMLDGTLTF